MTRILLTAILLFCFSAGYISAQNVGVDVASPVEKLDVLGAIRIGNTSNTNAGAIRWNSPNFQGYDGTQWVNFGGGTLTGSGTATRVAFWSGTSALSSNANLYWDNTNNRLGIGTTTPSGPIDVQTPTAGRYIRYHNAGNLSLYNPTGGFTGELRLGEGYGRPGLYSSGRLELQSETTGIIFANSNVEYMRMTSSGNFGVGITNPSAKISAGSSFGNKVLAYDDGTNGAGLGIQAGVLQMFTSNNTSNIVFGYGSSGSFTENMRIMGTGNVGIGTTAPTEKLDVLNGNLTVRTNANGTTAKIIISGARNGGNIGWNNTAGTGHSILEFINYDGGNSATFYTSGRIESANQPGSDDGDLRFYTSSDMVLQEVMRMDNTGNVGIGQEPTQKLDVNGKIRMRTGATTGYVPVSDANGTMTWTNPATITTANDGDWTISGTNQYSAVSGNVGIGTTAPAAGLHVYKTDGVQLNVSQGGGAIGGLYFRDGYTQANGRHFHVGIVAYDNSGSGTGFGDGLAISGFDGIAFTTNNTNTSTIANVRMLIQNNGNIGIGTTTAAQALDVNGKIQMRTGATTGYVPVSDANGTMTWTAPNSLLPPGTNGQTLRNNSGSWVANSLLYNDGTNIGIGTTAPSEKLEIQNGNLLVSTNAPFTSSKITIYGARQGGGAPWNTASGGGPAILNFDNYDPNSAAVRYTGAVIESGNNPGNNDGTLRFLTANNMVLAEAMRIDNTGNIGMGAEPTEKLHVVGHIRMVDGSQAAGYVPVSDANGTMTWTNPSSLTITETDPQVSSTTTNYIPKWNGTTLVDGVGYDNGTNVGIGTTAPDYKLHVSGSDYLTLKLVAPTNPLLKLSGSYNSGNGAEFWQDGTGDARLNINGTVNAIYMKSSGDVGIGMAFPTTPAARLDVNNGSSTVPIFVARDNGTEVMRIADGGNVGIGTTTPGAYLDITGTNAGTTSLQLRSGNSNVGTSSNQITFGYSGTETYRHAIKTRHNSGGAANNAIDFYVWKSGTDAAGTVGTEQVMTIDGANGGSVGIGTTTPAAPLDVRRSADTDGDAIAFGTPTYFMGRLGETATTNKVYIANTYNSDASFIDFRLKGNAESNSKMVIKGDGNVGIGTTSPVSKLHVSGATFTLNGYNTNPIELISGGSLPVFKWYGNGNLYFSNDPNTSNIGNEAVGTTQVMVLTPSGNVGIGTTSPSANLDVVGTVEMFGAWTSRSANTVYQAATDGFIIAWAGSAYFKVITDGSSTPTTVRMEAEGAASNAARPNAMCPVRKGDYWKVEGTSGGTPTVWWMPLGQ